MRELNGLSSDCRPVLTLSAKPELSVLIYLCGNFLIAVFVLLSCSWVHFSILLLIIPLLWMFYKSLQRYYFLNVAQSIQSLTLYMDDRLEVLLLNGQSVSVDFANKLLINKTLCLYFAHSCEGHFKVFLQQLGLFFGLNQMVIIVTENDANRDDFRRLLRYINKFH